MNQLNASVKPWEMNWGQHGDVVPKEICSEILKQLKPYGLLKAAQISKGWRLQVDQEWTVFSLDNNCFGGIVKTADLIWNQVNSQHKIALLKEEKKKIDQAAKVIKANFCFQNNHLGRVFAIYENLFSDLKSMPLETALIIFHDTFGMSVEKVTKFYLKCLPSFDFRLGSVDFIDYLSKEALEEFVDACMSEGRFELLMHHLNSITSYNQKKKFHNYITDLFSKSVEEISNNVFSNHFEIALGYFFKRACDEIKKRPRLVYAKRVKPIVDHILKNANTFVKTGVEQKDEFRKKLLEHYGIKWLLGYDCKVNFNNLTVLNRISMFLGLNIQQYNYHSERFELIYEIITALPEKPTFQDEMIRICEFYECVLKVKICLEPVFYCPLSNKLLIQAVRTPDGKVCDLQTIVSELDAYPENYSYTKKDLRPDFEKIHQVYTNLNKIWEATNIEKIDEIRKTWPNLYGLQRVCVFSFNAWYIKELIEEGKQRSYDDVHHFCAEEINKHLKQTQHLRLIYAEGKISKQDYQVYEKYVKLKNEMKEDYHYNLALV